MREDDSEEGERKNLIGGFNNYIQFGKVVTKEKIKKKKGRSHRLTNHSTNYPDHPAVMKALWPIHPV